MGKVTNHIRVHLEYTETPKRRIGMSKKELLEKIRREIMRYQDLKKEKESMYKDYYTGYYQALLWAEAVAEGLNDE